MKGQNEQRIREDKTKSRGKVKNLEEKVNGKKKKKRNIRGKR